jgi:hypothetical protein
MRLDTEAICGRSQQSIWSQRSVHRSHCIALLQDIDRDDMTESCVFEGKSFYIAQTKRL